ncbi:hypothetical protein Ami103574_08840 [Aminipila butyrica]|uniref:Uncharacterized protein n=1 Tax=Aminipila butyrica TaxID=433296 RepID=A0A858BW72_9FIRM|nr:hypothetical protein [Aminipila butyrica]QIB69429.1 hypothetical protein Ami103574_08840 [Aminipila butyrica]
MSDTIVFMSAYETTKYSKSKLSFKQKPDLDTLLDKHNLTYMLMDDKLISSKGTLKLSAKCDYIQQNTAFSFEPIKKKHTLDDFDEIIERTGFCIKLLHAQSVLADSLYFKIDPVIFSVNRTLIITFEVIDFETGSTLKKDDVFGKKGNYNLLTINGYQYFGQESTTPSNDKISEIIYNNVSSFFSEIIGEKFVPEDYSFIHNTLVLSNEINDVSDYFCNLIGTRELPSPLENISTTETYQYYPQDGASVITNYNPDDVDIPLYNGIILEAIKLTIYLSQIINLEITKDMNEVIRNDLYLENLFFAPHVPIETHNLLSYIYNTNSFQHHKEATKLKVSYMAAENESKRSRNGVLLNVLLYILDIVFQW